MKRAYTNLALIVCALPVAALPRTYAHPPSKRAMPTAGSAVAPPAVITSLSSRGTSPASTFALHGPGLRGKAPHQARVVYCLVRNTALPAATSDLLFTWTKDTRSPFFVYPYHNRPLPGPFTSTFLYIFAPGHYRCDVSVNGRFLGAARFTVTM